MPTGDLLDVDEGGALSASLTADDLRELLAKANEPKSGDALAGIAAGSMRERVAAKIVRGSIQANLTIQREGTASAVRVDRAALAELVAVARELGQAEPAIDRLLSIRGIVEIVEGDSSPPPGLNEALLATLDLAVADLAAVRHAEGVAIAKVLSARIDRIEELPIYALGTVDVALWDLTAKIAGLPLYTVIGGARDRIPAYASTVTFKDTAEFLDVVDQCLEYGFPAIKLHAWGDPKKDAKLCQDLRTHVGPDIELMYDGPAGFDLVEAIYVGRALAEAGYFWYEEPMREFNIDAYRRLALAVPIPLLSGETSDGAHYNMADFIVQDAAHMVRTETLYKGGITGGLRIAHLAESFNMRAEVHGGGLPNLHLACAIPNTTWYESLIYSNPIEVEPGIGRDGCISPPQVPGIGWGMVG